MYVTVVTVHIRSSYNRETGRADFEVRVYLSYTVVFKTDKKNGIEGVVWLVDSLEV